MNSKIKEALKQLPYKRQVRFAYESALETKHLITDPTYLKLLDLTALWLANVQEIENTLKQLPFTIHTNTVITDAEASVLDTAQAASQCDPIFEYSFTSILATSDALNIPLEHYYQKLLIYSHRDGI